MPVETYNRYSRYLHWLIAGLILFMIFLGWRLDDHDSLRLSRVNLHKSVGISILLLSFVRLGLRFAYKAPPEPPMPKWQAVAAQGLHVLFYVFMIGMPLTGWAMVSTSAREIPFFGLFPWPHMPFVPVSAAMENPVHEFFEFFHKTGAKILIYGMIPLHVLAALKHQFIDKDTVVEHMVPGLKPTPLANWRWIIPVGVVVLAVALGYGVYRGVPEKGGEAPPAPLSAGADMSQSASPSAVAAVVASSAVSSSLSSAAASRSADDLPVWTLDRKATKITFTTTFQGEAIKGAFGSYSATIVFDPAKLDKSHVKVMIDLASVNSGDGDRDSTLKSDTFFNVAAMPKAIFEAKSFSKTDATHFVAHGSLTLHGVTKPLDLPFTLTLSPHGDKADMSAQVDLDRTLFGVGSGDYASTDALPAKVGVTITLKATTAEVTH